MLCQAVRRCAARAGGRGWRLWLGARKAKKEFIANSQVAHSSARLHAPRLARAAAVSSRLFSLSMESKCVISN